MKFFLDTACEHAVEKASMTGLIEGITTNPTLIAREKKNVHQVISALCNKDVGPVSVEVMADKESDMVSQAERLANLSSHVVIKVPLTEEGLKACRKLRAKGIAVNVTLCFSVNQALLAAKADATYVSLFVGRLDDEGVTPGIDRLREIHQLYETWGYSTQILAASIRHPFHVEQISRARVAHVMTMPPAVFHALYGHPLTEKGLDIFVQNWNHAQQSL